MSFANREASHNGEGLTAVEPPGAQATLNAEPPTWGGGAVRNDLSTALVRLYRELFGRGPEKATTYAFEAGYVTFLREVLVPHERTLVLSGRTDLVCQARAAIREAERERLIGAVQRATGRLVLHDAFQFQPERNLVIEVFWTPTGSEEGPGATPARYALAPTTYPEAKVMSR